MTYLCLFLYFTGMALTGAFVTAASEDNKLPLLTILIVAAIWPFFVSVGALLYCIEELDD